MRRFLKIFITVIVLAGGFIAYLLYQPSAARQAGSMVTPMVQPRQSSEGDLLVGKGEYAWVRQFDDQGKLSSRFRAQKWDPQKNGLVKVTRPEAELFVKGKGDARAKISIQGTDGDVVSESLPEASQADAPLDPKNMSASPVSQPQPPSSGRLNGVVIRVFEADTATEPTVTMRTNNIVFDNETFRISTETYVEADGTNVPSDQVAVSVEGRDFDFYGRGLTVRWNDVDQRLELLRIAHGDKLIIKNPSAMSGSLFGDKKKKEEQKSPDVTAAAQRPAGLWAPLAEMLASADPKGAGAALDASAQPSAAKGKRKRKADAQAKPAQTRPARKKDQPPYRAIFNEDVRVIEGEDQVATADLMNVDFLMSGSGSTSGTDDATKEKRPTTGRSPATAPAPAPRAMTAPADAEATTKPTTQEIADATTQPTTAPAPKPVTIYWVGELTVTPMEPLLQPKPLVPGEAGVEMIGTKSPVVLTRDNSTVTCARFAYRTDGTLSLEKSDAFPQIVLTHRSPDKDAGAGAAPAPATGPAAPDASLTTVTTDSVHYSFAERMATLRGRSHVTAPIESKNDAEAGTMDASWTEVATFRLVGERQDDLWVEKAEFAGDVDVKAPQGTVQAQQLALLFDPPTPEDDAAKAQKRRRKRDGGAAATQPFANTRQPNLRKIIATDRVSCEMTDARQGRQTVQCQRLELETAKADDGKLFPQTVDAQGAVHASDQSQDLKAGHVVLKLRPAPRKDQPVAQGMEADEQELADASEQAADVNTRHPEPLEDLAVIADAREPEADGAEARDAAAPKDDAPRSNADKTVASVALQSMVATDSVEVHSKDGAVATGRRLEVTVDADTGAQHVELSGEPARVVDAKNGTVTGRTLTVDPQSSVAHIPGEGSLAAVQRTDEEKAQGKPGKPVEVTWEEGADLYGQDNRIEVAGKVSLRITEPDGTVRTATAGHVNLQLVDKKPAVAGEKSKDSTSAAPESPKEQDAGVVKMDALKDKDIGVVTFRDNAVVNSERRAADGTVVQRVHLKGPVITYDVPRRHLTVPCAGQMLVENHDEPGAKGKPKDAKAGKKEDPSALANDNGATAFEWKKSMEFETSAGRAVMTGGVIVTHQPDDKTQPPVRLDGDQLTAVFVTEGDGAGPKAAGAAAAANAADVPRFQIRSVNAVGNIVLAREGAELMAGRIDYDPATQWLVARGDDRNPAVFTDPNGTQSTTARELWLNTKTWHVTIKGANVRVGGLAK